MLLLSRSWFKNTLFSVKELDIDESVEALENGTFAPVDLRKLVNILGEEITQCEIILKDELEKRKKYTVM